MINFIFSIMPAVLIQVLAITHIVLRMNGYEFSPMTNIIMVVLLLAGWYHMDKIQAEVKEEERKQRKKNLDKFR